MVTRVRVLVAVVEAVVRCVQGAAVTPGHAGGVSIHNKK